jgi:hypothetical protein
MKLTKKRILGLFLASLLFLTFLSPPQPVDLIVLWKDPLIDWEFLRFEQIPVVQELDSCYLARLERDRIDILDVYGVQYDILDTDIKDREFFLVYSSSPYALQSLRQRGKAATLEKDTFIFWTNLEDASAAIPAEMLCKALPAEPISIDLRPASAIPPENIFIREANPFVQQAADSVSTDYLRFYIQTLQDFVTRYAPSAGLEAAGDFIFHQFQSFGLEPIFQPFAYTNNLISRNVIAELKGKTFPDEVVIICAHYDSKSQPNPTILSPGADDNASGTAAVLEAARILANYPLDFTVRFIAFSAEERGLYGSKAYALDASNKNEKIIGVLNLDMIAYANYLPEDLEVVVNPRSDWLAEKLIQSAQTYAPMSLPMRKHISLSFIHSDHSPFWDRGYSAFCAIEDNPLTNPNYHTVSDTIGTLNFDFATQVVRAVLAALADLAQPALPGYPSSPEGLAAKTTVISSLFKSIKNVRLTWNPVAGAIGYNIYRSTFAHVYYQKLNTLPVQANSFIDKNLAVDAYYYYVVTTVGPSGLESNFSREVEIPSGYQLSSASPSFLSFLSKGQL